MNAPFLYEQIKQKQSFLCIGLDSEFERLPHHIVQTDDPQFEFNKQIIDATHDLAIAYKPNIAFYEALGNKGWLSLRKTVEYIRENYPGIFLIADAKRADIGNTSRMYAKTFFELFDFDAVTVSPYMGSDSIAPFLEYNNKWTIILALTSNEGARDFQLLYDNILDHYVFDYIIEKSMVWCDNPSEKIMFVVGATQTMMLKRIRKLAPEHFFLIPGVGAQGGSLENVVKYGMNKNCGLIVNASRSIIFAGSLGDFAVKARQKAEELQLQMKNYLADCS